MSAARKFTGTSKTRFHWSSVKFRSGAAAMQLPLFYLSALASRPPSSFFISSSSEAGQSWLAALPRSPGLCH